jgi:hypothetical protein
MRKFWLTKKFKLLQKKWYEKLREADFVDVEHEFDGEFELTQRSSNAYRQASFIVRESKVDYYRLIGHYTHNEKFDDPVDEIVMKMVAEGAKIKAVSEELKRQGFKCHRQTIRYIIRRYENQWGIRRWNQKQLTSKR